MQLKDYQVRSLDIISLYLKAIKAEKAANPKHACLDVWPAFGQGQYFERRNGIGEDVPNFCLKVPTAGGKTLLAVKTIDLINTKFLYQNHGLVLWIVPTNQIYNQTLKSLRDKSHPYRQFLDQTSSGRTLILERSDRFAPDDVSQNLVVLLLMLPAANRLTKDSLKVFKDNGKFLDFFPPEGHRQAQQELLQKIPNLDTFGSQNSFFSSQIKTSLGNVLRLIKPAVILDEGQKAYSQLAQETIYGLNPSIIVELSATPPDQSNILVNIPGLDLKREGMIKLDLHVVNKTSEPDWRQTLLSAVNQRNLLEDQARKYEQNTDIYIRPICLIQAERTGRDQRGSGFIHAEDVREYLIKSGISPDQIAVKTSQTDELKEVDDTGGLMGKSCQIRYIITKQALQEGWDCPFAYVLTILTNPSSKTAMTQLVGRILRQPYAKKTGLLELDESYVFCFRPRADELTRDIETGFKSEGLGDLVRQIRISDDFSPDLQTQTQVAHLRSEFSTVAKKITLPMFAINSLGIWRLLEYKTDIISRIPWNKIGLSLLSDLILSDYETKDIIEKTTIDDTTGRVVTSIAQQTRNGSFGLDMVLFSRQILDLVPNPWTAHGFAQSILGSLIKRHGPEKVKNNFLFILESTRNLLQIEKDRLAKEIFTDLLEQGAIRFGSIGDKLGFKFPDKITYQTSALDLARMDRAPIQKSLFDFNPEDEFNPELERPAVDTLDKSPATQFWYRNIAKHDYHLQGWQSGRVYPDFIVSASDQSVLVLETKGEQLTGNTDTTYKQNLFDLCNELSGRIFTNDLGIELEKLKISYHMIYGSSWHSQLNQLLEGR